MSHAPTIDPTTDSTASVLSQLSRRYTFPDFVKSAELEETLQPQTLPSSSFAWPQQQKYPCHSSAATWLSAAYFFDKVASLRSSDKQQIEKRLESFADYFGIRGAYEDLKKQAATLNEPQQLPDDCYAFISTSEQGHKECFYPLMDGHEIKTATSWLEANRERIPFAHRTEIGRKILSRANRIGVKLAETEREFLEKQSGDGLPDRPALLQAIEVRANLTKTAEEAAAVRELAAAVQKTPAIAMQTPELLKLAGTLDMLDYTLGLKGKYTSLIQRPEDVVFAFTHSKIAAAKDNKIELANGSIYDRSQISGVTYNDIREVLGDSFATEVCNGFQVDATKLAEIAATLPRGDAELFDTLLRSAGNLPVAHKDHRYAMG
jgi:hypothetical protein